MEPPDTPAAAEQLYKQLLEEIFTEIVFQVEIEKHLEQSMQGDLKKYTKDCETSAINQQDIFNNANSKETNECVCPNCGRTLGAIRFAPHLEKCVGMGRSSSRIASRRILASSNSGKEGKYSDDASDGNGGGGGSGSQSQGNGEWVPPKALRRVDSRKKKDRNSKHGGNNHNGNNHTKSKKKAEEASSANNATAEDGDDLNYNNMNYEQRQHVLAHMCGVVSEHTGRLCTRSVRCPKHSDEQRNSVRAAVLSNNNGLPVDFAKMTVQEGKAIEDIEMIDVDLTTTTTATAANTTTTTTTTTGSPVKKSDRYFRPK